MNHSFVYTCCNNFRKNEAATYTKIRFLFQIYSKSDEIEYAQVKKVRKNQGIT